MNSSKALTKYTLLSKGNLEWEIQNFNLHFKRCESCWKGDSHYDCPFSYYHHMQTEPMQLAVSEGKFSTCCYGNLMNNPELADFKIICQGTTFHTNKFILSVRSRVFRAMIEIGLSESTQNELKIEDLTLKTVQLMLEYIYKGTLEVFPEDVKDKIELLDCAEKYELDGLKFMCKRKLFSSLPTIKDVGELAMAAFTYGANEGATKVIKEFCIKNHSELIRNPEYKNLFLMNPQAFMD